MEILKHQGTQKINNKKKNREKTQEKELKKKQERKGTQILNQKAFPK